MTFQTKTFYLLVLGVILINTPSILSAPYTKTVCNPSKRPSASSCSRSPRKPVCGFYTKNCPLDVCHQRYDNGCYACSDSKTLYYRDGSCDVDYQVYSCSSYCNKQYDRKIYEQYNPVCAISNAKCSGSACYRTFDNYCLACDNRNYKWYTNGVCYKDRDKCPFTPWVNKCSIKSSVCAFWTDSSNNLYHTTANSPKDACNDRSILYFTPGKCKWLDEDTSYYCFPNNRPSSCTRKYDPVCAHYKEEKNGKWYGEVSNSCVACRDKNVLYYEPGECRFQCERNPNIIVDCLGGFSDPVCGHYTDENGRPQQVSLQEGCLACYYYNNPQIDYYTDGLCPSDYGVRCENLMTGLGSGSSLTPVCALYEEWCSDSSCWTTFADPWAACQSGAVIIMPGICPGEQGISCEPYRPDSSYGLCGPDNNVFYEDVCGYSQYDCNASWCRKAYSNHCDACIDSSVLFFSEGPCNKKLITAPAVDFSSLSASQ